MFNNVFGQNVSNILNLRGMSQGQLAFEAGISRQTVNKLLKATLDDHSIKLDTAIAVARSLNVDFPKLFSKMTAQEINEMSSFEEQDYLLICRENLKRISLNKGKSRRSLSTEPGIRESTISEILSGQVKNPYIASIIYMADALDIETSALFRRGG